MTAEPRRRRPRARAKRAADEIHQRPWRVLENLQPPMELLSADQVEAIHRASLALLRDLGVEFMSAEARGVLARAGADVDDASGIVRFDPAMIEDAVAKAPSSFTLHARNPARSLPVGGRHVVHTLVSSAPNISDLDAGRRPGTHEDQRNLMKLGQMLNVIHMGGISPVEAMDLPVHSRNLDLVHGFLTLTDKAFMCRCIGREQVIDTLDMCAAAFGKTREDLNGFPVVMTNININSPRRMDEPLTIGAMTMADHGQPVTVTPFTLAGAMAPVTLAGALTQQNAEALALIAFLQIYRPGTPVAYGGFTSNVDMKSGAPAFGTPEYAKGVIATGQLTRRYGLPYRASNVNASNAPDAQAAYESMMSLWACMTGGVNLIYHGAGWLEGGLTASYEKVIIDADLLQMTDEMMLPIEVSDETIALDAVAEAGVGGHFFGAAHTIGRYETAFYEPLVSDWRNFENWRDAGAPQADVRANALWKQLLREYQPPPMDSGVRETLDACMARRKKDIGEGKW
ncbi:MAG: trimethylamine methyltransferase family protein [Rhodospirillales bacterium]